MKIKVDWLGLLKAVFKAVAPFLMGALGGLSAGCSVWGSGVGVTM